MARDLRRPWLWTNRSIAALGFWLITSPFTFGYRSDEPMLWNDILSGLLLVAFALVALVPTARADFWGRWGAGTVGLWLQFAPLVLWARSPAAYVGDTFIGSFAIAFSVLVPGMPGMAHHMEMMKPGSEIPPGWTYNPSSWLQRGPIIALGLAGWLVSRTLAAVQLGYVPAAWEPFFGPGTDRVLHSEVSRMWPISDAGLGAAAYTLEVLMGFMGPVTRWRTMPWMVLLFGILVVPLGLTHVTLVILQPVVVGAWCSLCLAAAALMLLMVPLTVDEVVAMLQFMARTRRQGKPFWRTFWVGGTTGGGRGDDRSPPHGASMSRAAPAMVWGVTAPWTLLASAALGVWLMAAPAVLDSSGAAADSDRIAGALTLTIAVVAMAEVVRAGRFLNVLTGLWIAVSPWMLQGSAATGRWKDLAVGLLLVALSLPRGAIREHYGAWDRAVV